MAFDASFNTTAPTGSGVGNREQLLDLTTVLAPRQAPVYGLLPKQAATADLVEWTVDGLRDPNADNAVIEGKDVGDGGGTLVGQFGNLTRLNNRLQHFRDTFNVSKKQEIFDSVTPVRIQEAEEKAASQVLRDIESAICSDNPAVSGASGAAGKLRGLGIWLDPTVVDATSAGVHLQKTDAVEEVPDIYKTKTGAVLDGDTVGTHELTESRFNGMLTSVFEETGESQDLLLVAGTEVRNAIIDGFTRVQPANNATVYNQGDGTEVNYNVEIFQGPYGVVKILSANPKCLPDQKRAYLLDPSLLGWSEAMSMGSTMLEDQGGGPRGYIDAMGTLCVKGPNGLGMIKDFA